MANLKSSKYFFVAIPFIIIGTLFFVLYHGLTINPYSTSVKIINKPSPQVRITNIFQWNNMIDTKSLSQQNQGRWFLVNFWASWCETCQNEHPFLMDLARQGVTIYGMDYNDAASSAKKWLTSYGNPYAAVLWDARSIAGANFGVTSIPTTFLVNPNGRLAVQITGPLTLTIWNEQVLPIIEKDVSK